MPHLFFFIVIGKTEHSRAVLTNLHECKRLAASEGDDGAHWPPHPRPSCGTKGAVSQESTETAPAQVLRGVRYINPQSVSTLTNQPIPRVERVLAKRLQVGRLSRQLGDSRVHALRRRQLGHPLLRQDRALKSIIAPLAHLAIPSEPFRLLLGPPATFGARAWCTRRATGSTRPAAVAALTPRPRSARVAAHQCHGASCATKPGHVEVGAHPDPLRASVRAHPLGGNAREQRAWRSCSRRARALQHAASRARPVTAATAPLGPNAPHREAR
eukprot:scaffold120935_cov29-Tisochrysis_lutea.AAC.3